MQSDAERGGFEPPVALYALRRFSKPVHSTTLPPLRGSGLSLAFDFHRFNGIGATVRDPLIQMDGRFDGCPTLRVSGLRTPVPAPMPLQSRHAYRA